MYGPLADFVIWIIGEVRFFNSSDLLESGGS